MARLARLHGLELGIRQAAYGRRRKRRIVGDSGAQRCFSLRHLHSGWHPDLGLILWYRGPTYATQRVGCRQPHSCCCSTVPTGDSASPGETSWTSGRFSFTGRVSYRQDSSSAPGPRLWRSTVRSSWGRGAVSMFSSIGACETLNLPPCDESWLKVVGHSCAERARSLFGLHRPTFGAAMRCRLWKRGRCVVPALSITTTSGSRACVRYETRVNTAGSIKRGSLTTRRLDPSNELRGPS